MSRWYLDTSAAWKLLAREAESAALAHELDAKEPDLVGCWLLETEMRRAVPRHPTVTQEMVSDLLGDFDLYAVPAHLYRLGGLFPGSGLRSLDALHLAAAVEIGVDHVVTYDSRMAESARLVGLRVLAPA